MKTLFFTPRLFGSSLFELSDFSVVKDFVENLEGGILYDRYTMDFQPLFTRVKSSSSYEKMILFLDLVGRLQNLSGRILSSKNQHKPFSEKEGTKMRDVMNYTFLHFKEEISLNDISSIAFLSPNAFCRYFRKKTNKTYFQFLIEIRINNACKLLWKNPELTVEEVILQSGFSNASNFYRQFKAIKGQTPIEFRKGNQ
jgi:AraC-like DNA-binding protein